MNVGSGLITTDVEGGWKKVHDTNVCPKAHLK